MQPQLRLNHICWRNVVVVVLFLITSVTSNNFTFPGDFLLGTATSAYQVEGGWKDDGKGASIWDTDTHRHPNFIADGSNGDIAADSFHNFAEDVRLLKEIGVHFYRFSISWSRVLPNGQVNVVNQAGIDYYNNLINELLRNNIQPMVTIYHWDLPQALQDLGGWANIYVVDYFEDYARLLFKIYGDRVKWWITINEPILIGLGYSETKGKAPNVNEPGIGDYLAAKTMLLAHARAYHVYDKEFRNTQKGKIAITLNTSWFEPRTNDSKNVEAAESAIQSELGLYAHPIFSSEGDYPPRLMERAVENSKKEGFRKSRLPSLSKDEINYIRGTSDFFGLNHYTSYLTASGEDKIIPSRRHDSGAVFSADPSCPSGISNWLSVVPWGFRKTLRWIKKEYNNPPVFVTENGYSDDGRLQDTERINFYVDYLREMLKAMHEDGCNVIGYTAWSLLDNFQWNDGFTEKFGLIYVNYSDPSRGRVHKESSFIYKEIIKNGEVPDRYPLFSYDGPDCRPIIPV